MPPGIVEREKDKEIERGWKRKERPDEDPSERRRQRSREAQRQRSVALSLGTILRTENTELPKWDSRSPRLSPVKCHSNPVAVRYGCQ